MVLAGIPLTFATILVASGARIETKLLFHLNHEVGFYVLLLWIAARWTIAILTSIAVIALIYHNAVPRTQPWHSVLPGAVLATGMWFAATLLFGWYLRRYADYSIMYGSLGVAHRSPGLDVHDLSHHPCGRGVQRHALSADAVGPRADGDFHSRQALPCKYPPGSPSD